MEWNFFENLDTSINSNPGSDLLFPAVSFLNIHYSRRQQSTVGYNSVQVMILVEPRSSVSKSMLWYYRYIGIIFW